MKNKLKDIIVGFSHNTVDVTSLEIEKENFLELLRMYLNDKNSSTLRQEIMCSVAGLSSNPNKLGYDSENSFDEMKPKNIDTTNPKSKKLDGRGNYTDMTFKRHNVFCEENAQIHIGGFVNGKQIYQLKLPYVGMKNHFENQLRRRLPNGDQPTQYLRSMNFSLSQIVKCPNVELIYITSELDIYKPFITKSLYTYLIQLQKS